MAYVDLNSVTNPAPLGTIPSAWGDQIRDNFVAIRNPPLVVASLFDNIPDSTPTKISFGSATHDTASMWSGGNPSRFTYPADGFYAITVQTKWDSNATGRRFTQVLHSTAGQLGETDLPPSTGSNTSYPTCVVPREYSAGDYIEFEVYQTSGITLGCLVHASMYWFGE